MANNNITIVGRLRHFVLSRLRKRQFKAVGKSLSFSPENSVFRYGSIRLGDNVFIGKDAIFSCEADIGNYVMFGPRVYITSGRHEYTIVGKRIRQQGESGVKKVVIEDDCWIGEGSLITRGVRIGEGTVIGGMSVVSHSMPPYCVCVGNPCRPIKLRYSDDELKKHIEIINNSGGGTAMVERRKAEMESAGYVAKENGSIVRIEK